MKNDHLIEQVTGTEIAVVGMAGRFPGAANIDTFWHNIRDGVEAIRTYSDEALQAAHVRPSLLRNPNYVKAGAPLDNMEQFDAPFFGFGPRDAAIMDPQHRHFLECAWEALEHAGYVPESFNGRIGVFGGSGHNAYLPLNLLTNPDLLDSVGFFLLRHTGNDKDFLTTRVSYVLDLTGPSVNVQTACSTSLVAIHMAGQSLQSFECDMALAGGVTIELPHRHGYLYHEGEILSPDGHCRAFDADSQGTVFGSGVGIVVLRRLEDALRDGDTIHAVVLSTAINNDGHRKMNYLAPSVDGQATAILDALDVAELEATDIQYVEAHGTGTPIGDPIEIAALTQAYRASTDRKQFCAIGSVKTNIGHLDTAAGIASFIKLVQALKHKQMPPSLNYQRPNPECDFANSPFFVNATLRDWVTTEEQPRRGGVSSLGVGGTNAHLIVEEAPKVAASDRGRPTQLLVLSARSKQALNNMSHNLAHSLRQTPAINLADVAYTLQHGRRAFTHRRVLAVTNTAEAATLLEDVDRNRVFDHELGHEHEPAIIFSFPGGGAQYPNMGRHLYQTEPIYRQHIDHCLDWLQREANLDVRPYLFPETDQVNEAAEMLKRPSYSLPVIFMTEYAMAQLLQAWGIEATAVTGHSMGEYTAACLAGVLTPDDALAIVTIRGQLFETLPNGGMISINLPEAEVAPLLVEGLAIAVINAPDLCVVSGPTPSIEQMEAKLAAREIDHNRININVAAHSPMLDPILDPFSQKLQTITFHPPTKPIIANVTGAWMTEAQAISSTYWVNHLRQTVRFADGLETLLTKYPHAVLVEVGPGKTLSTLAKMHPQKSRHHATIPTMRHRQDDAKTDVMAVLEAFGQLWSGGVPVDWQALYDENEWRHRIPLPTYPFEHQRYWIEPGQVTAVSSPPTLSKLPHFADWFHRPLWQPAPPILSTELEPAKWLCFADELGLSEQLVAQLRGRGHTVYTVKPSGTFAHVGGFDFTVNPLAKSDYDRLITILAQQGQLPNRILHTWLVKNHRQRDDRIDIYYQNQEAGFYSLMFLAQVMSEQAPEQLDIRVIANGSHALPDEPLSFPEKSTILGPVRVIPHEYPQMRCQLIDIKWQKGRWGQPTEAQKASIKALLQEFATSIEEPILLHRQGIRWQQQLHPHPLPKAPQSQLKKGGVYLITGGLGGIGLTMAAHLAENYQAKLILLSRSGLPAPDQWQQWLHMHPLHDKVSQRIRHVQALEAAGASVTTVRADVTNREQVKEAIIQAKAQHGRIDGVIHAAGVLQDNLIQLKTTDEVNRVLSPKVRGALVLNDLLQTEPLDLFILFSSTSAWLGPIGQMDYVSANAFLNAFAQQQQQRKPDTTTVAINWGVWQKVGMAVETAVRLGLTTEAGAPVPHPLLDQCLVNTDRQRIYTTAYRIKDHWLLSQHRIKGGQALIPGTGYLEIAKAAFTNGAANGPMQISKLAFLTPLDVQANETKTVRVTLERAEQGYAFAVSSEVEAAVWQEHARGLVSHLTPPERAALDLDAIRARCQQGYEQFAPGSQKTRQEAFLAFGPRWKSLRRVDYGQGEALAQLTLLPEFVDDLNTYTLHPALLDIATTTGLPLLDGYTERDDFYVPLMYERVQALAPLTPTIYSHVTLKTASTEVPAFDVTITDEGGRPLLIIHAFTMKRINHQLMLRNMAQPAATHAVTGDDYPLLRLALTDGITPAEGSQALAYLTAVDTPPVVIVSSLDLAGMQTLSVAADSKEEGVKVARPELQSDYAAPRDSIETTLAETWQTLLSVDKIGIHDDFFELGGHSLIAVRLSTQVKKKYGLDFSLATLFTARTIAEYASLIKAEIGEVGDDETTEPRHKPARHPILIPIQPRGNKPPFFCVHGIFGNVLNLYPLSVYLDPDQPFYGLQSPGVDGKTPIPNDVEAIGQLYVEAIRTVQPQGPYYLGGFSLGGELAYEVAQQLHAQGETVAVLALLDTFEPSHARELLANAIPPKEPIQPLLATPTNGKPPTADANREPALVTPSTSVYQRLSRRAFNVLKKAVTDPVWLAYSTRAWVWDQRDVVRYRLSEQYINRGRLIPQDLIPAYVWGRHTEALVNHYPKPYPGTITLFRATLTMEEDTSRPGMRWQSLAAAVDLHLIHGTHNIVVEPYVGEVARDLQRSLRQAQNRYLT